ncbi:MAG: hypothetical protein ACM3JD_05150 [Rudaea sp.]
MSEDRRFSLLVALGLILGGAILSALLIWFADFGGAAALKPAQAPPAAAGAVAPTAQSAAEGGVLATFNPPKPEDAPKDLHEAVMLGANMMTDTVHALPNYVGNKMNCTNCHFDGGVTQGGKNGGISLVGVTATYPKYRDRQKFAVDMVARVND